ncbi:MAG: PP0621 family protein [Moraxellaceae bacterium]|nr:PP0621 family protein [Moraxellaceae bacterium]
MGLILRLLLLGALAWVVYRFVKGFRGAPRPDDDTPAAPPPGQQAMRRCAQCGVHVPEGESTQSRGHFFCSEAHRDAYLREHP